MPFVMVTVKPYCAGEPGPAATSKYRSHSLQPRIAGQRREVKVASSSEHRSSNVKGIFVRGSPAFATVATQNQSHSAVWTGHAAMIVRKDAIGSQMFVSPKRRPATVNCWNYSRHRSRYTRRHCHSWQRQVVVTRETDLRQRQHKYVLGAEGQLSTSSEMEASRQSLTFTALYQGSSCDASALTERNQPSST